jgi:hypothetical protein
MVGWFDAQGRKSIIVMKKPVVVLLIHQLKV